MSETNTKLLQETSKTYKDEMTYRFQKRPLSRIVFYYLDFNYNVDSLPLLQLLRSAKMIIDYVMRDL